MLHHLYSIQLIASLSLSLSLSKQGRIIRKCIMIILKHWVRLYDMNNNLNKLPILILF